jgi:hypothetical protein
MTPSPDIRVCLDCGWSEFVIPQSWLSAGWLRSLRPQPAVNETTIGPVGAPAVVM